MEDSTAVPTTLPRAEVPGRRPDSSAAVERSGRIAAAVTGGMWLAGFIRVLSHAVFVSHDTLINYAHVWFVSDRLWHGHGVPLRMPVLGHGEAFAFPYGLVPWLSAAVFRPLLGDRTVTLWLVLGAVGLVATTLWAVPELRRGWWTTAILVNPALVAAVVIGQLPFLWAAALLMAAVGCWRRGWHWPAAALASLAQVTHPAVLGPITAAVVALGLLLEPNRRLLVRLYLLSLLPVVPAALIVTHSPVFVESSPWVKAANLAGTVAPRALVFVVPLALVVLGRRTSAAWVGPLAVAALILMNAAMWESLDMPWAWRALSRPVDPRMVAFTRSADFTPGATYRVLRVADGKVGMYQLLRAGGRLDSEFFPESILRQSWPGEAAYSALLRRRHVDDVMVWRGYTTTYHVNELDLLETMARRPRTDCGGPVVCVSLVVRTPDYVVFGVTRS